MLPDRRIYGTDRYGNQTMYEEELEERVQQLECEVAQLNKVILAAERRLCEIAEYPGQSHKTDLEMLASKLANNET